MAKKYKVPTIPIQPKNPVRGIDLVVCECGERYTAIATGVGAKRAVKIKDRYGAYYKLCPNCSRNLQTQWWKDEIRRWCDA